MLYVGIDPGFTGAIAVLTPDDNDFVIDMPVMTQGSSKVVDGRELAINLMGLGDPEDVFCVLELASSFGNEGRGSLFKYARGFGTIEGVLSTLGIHTKYVTPAHWKPMFVPKGADKDASRLVAMDLYPQLEGRLKRKKDHNRAEAILLARVARQYHIDKTEGKK